MAAGGRTHRLLSLEDVGSELRPENRQPGAGASPALALLHNPPCPLPEGQIVGTAQGNALGNERKLNRTLKGGG